jgi:cyanophycinase
MRGPWLLTLAMMYSHLPAAAATPAYRYFLTGDARDVRVRTRPGYLLAGGGETDDDSFRWFLSLAGGGDVVVLRASGGDGYQTYFNRLARVDSVETILFHDAASASDPFVLARIRGADALFIAGGDQWNYVRLWKDTPVEDEINRLARRGVPIGGTSAGLAVLSEYSFAARHDTVTSAQALADPFDEKVSIAHDFLALPGLGCLITDSHFSRRDRMGRLLVFLGRIRDESNCRKVRAIAVDERAAVRVTGAGQAIVAGEGSAFFLELRQAPNLMRGSPANIPSVAVAKVPCGAGFDIKRWKGRPPSTFYELKVEAGQARSSLAGGGLYGAPN